MGTLKATIDVDIKNLDEITKKTIKDLQRQIRSLNVKLTKRNLSIKDLEHDIRVMECEYSSDKASFRRIKHAARELAEEFKILVLEDA